MKWRKISNHQHQLLLEGETTRPVQIQLIGPYPILQRKAVRTGYRKAFSRERQIHLLFLASLSSRSHLTLVNFVKGMIGSGILTLPIVFRQAGLWTAFGLVFLFGFLNSRTMTSLVKCAHQLSNNNRKSEGNGTDKLAATGEPLNYGEVMETAMAGSFDWARPYARASK
jgi:hypothetical protein